MKRITYVLLILFLIPLYGIYAQTTKVRGKVFDTDTKEPIPFVNVAFVGTLVGTTTDENGFFFLETRENVDSLSISFIGYLPQTLSVTKYRFKTINVFLKQESYSLNTVVIKGKKRRRRKKDDPAVLLFKKIVKHKERNNPDRFDTYYYSTYNKMELDLTNFTEKFKNKKMLRPFKFVWEHVDTSAVTGKPYLPVMLSESLSDIYFSKKVPSIKREIIKASKISGYSDDNISIAQFTGKLYQDVNIFDNYIQLFGQGFVSPISNSGLLFYRYYITDSAYRKNSKAYQLSFRPIRKEDPAFVGDLWVTDSTYAIQDINMRITGDVNLNWVNDVVLQDNFQLINDSIWFWEKQYVFVDFSIVDKDSTKAKGFFGHKTTIYENVKINVPIDKTIFKYDKELVVQKDAFLKGEEYWDTERPHKLTEKEQEIYKMVDSIKEVPLYRTLETILETIFSGYFDMKYFEIGPYHKIFSFNDFEDYRIRFGGRTTSNLSKRIRIGGHIAFGTKDKDFKYNAAVRYMFSKKNELRHMLDIHAKKDVEQLGRSPNAFTESNILASVLARNPSTKLTLIDEYGFNYHREWKTGLSNSLSFKYREIEATPTVNFQQTPSHGNINQSKISTSEVTLNLRWTKDERVIETTFNRYTIDSEYPIINFDVSVGAKVLGGDYNYFKINLNYEHDFLINPLGKLRYYFIGGKIFGDVPYPLLHLHEGNETYAYDPYAFNMMNYYEFASDQFISLYAEHHFNGFIINKIPLLKKTRWRTLIAGKALWGTLREENNGIFDDSKAIFYFPEGLTELNHPYYEASVGIENIFKILRIDAVWRLNHLTPKGKQNIDKFGIRVMLQLKF